MGLRLFPQDTDPVHLPGLRLGGERRKSETDSENDREPDQPHGHLVEDGWRESSRTPGAHQRGAARGERGHEPS